MTMPPRVPAGRNAATGKRPKRTHPAEVPVLALTLLGSASLPQFLPDMWGIVLLLSLPFVVAVCVLGLESHLE
ncbi:MAG: hypothetical protein KC492_19560 [Myxococcales bacterium]|nr:hypothetical protein [Myxococcales bacterium]